MNTIKSVFFSAMGGYALSYALGNIWFYSAQEYIFKPIDLSALNNPDHNFGTSVGLYFIGWKNIFFDFYGFTDYEAEMEKERLERESKGYKADKY